MPAPLPIRVEDPPADTVVIIRAGAMSADGVLHAARRTMRRYGLFGISVEAAVGMSVIEACRSSERLARYRQIRLSTFGRVRAAGFALLATFDSPHFTLVLSDLSEVTLARLERCFDAPTPNPAGDRGR